MSYIDGFVIAVPTPNKQEFIDHASRCDCPPGPNLRLAALLERTPGLSSNISRCSHRAA